MPTNLIEIKNFRGDGVRLWVYARMGQDCDRVNVPSPKTRGDVRRLCKALGIELKEASDG